MLNCLQFVRFYFLILTVSATDRYRIYLDRIEYYNANNSPLIVHYDVFKVNRTLTGVNVTYELKEDLHYDFNDVITAKTFEFLDNQYKPFAVNIKRVFCDFIEAEYKMFFAKDVGSLFLPTKCPIKKVRTQLRCNTAAEASRGCAARLRGFCSCLWPPSSPSDFLVHDELARIAPRSESVSKCSNVIELDQ